MEPRFLKVEGHSYLLRDTDSNAIINVDKKGHGKYLALRRLKEKDIERVTSLEDDVKELKSDITDIKDMIGKLLDK
jgi:hypothetical protein|tara:strand:+ start:592 stop:819 length:228 start_codon:yes stop_codon:yes gene_type:complete